MITIATDSYSIKLDESQEIVILNWKRDVSPFVYRQGCRQVFDIINRKQLRSCLLFTSSCGYHSMEAGEWEVDIIEKEFSTSSLEELSVALVMTEEKYQRMIHSYSLSQVTLLEKPLNINYFTDTEEAMDWLLHEPSFLSYSGR